MDLKEVDILGASIGRHWYYRAKASAMLAMLSPAASRTLLDVGAGSGFFSRHLLAHDAAEEAWCIDTSYAEEADEHAQGKPIHFRRTIDRLDADLVLLMDVLEHVEDDAGLLLEYVAKVPAGCRFLVTVPAFQFLWSGHDVFLGHRRRYTLKQLEATVEKAGLTCLRGNYFFALTFPLAASLRLWQRAAARDATPRSQLAPHSPPVNALLELLCRVELPFMKANRLAGLSAFCLAVKP